MDELIAKNPRLLKEYREKVAKKRYLKRKGGKDSKFASNGWIFDKLFTKNIVPGKAPTPTQKMRSDDPPYKQQNQESINYYNLAKNLQNETAKEKKERKTNVEKI